MVVPYVGTWIEIWHIRPGSCCSWVVPYVGTWIEIKWSSNGPDTPRRRSLRGNVDRNAGRSEMFLTVTGRSLRGNVDRNPTVSAISFSVMGRSLRGNVDRNVIRHTGRRTFGVVPYVGTWIEIFTLKYLYRRCRVVPYVGTWIEMWLLRIFQGPRKSLPTWERG